MQSIKKYIWYKIFIEKFIVFDHCSIENSTNRLTQYTFLLITSEVLSDPR